jgi:hypothetical protein
MAGLERNVSKDSFCGAYTQVAICRVPP